MFHIKICGVRQPVDISAVQNCGGDAVGLNFFAKSIRFVDPTSPQTKTLSRLAVEAGLCRVGVFVNSTADRIAEIAQAVGLDMLQLHGDEPVETAQTLISDGRWTVIRAIKLPPTDPITIDQINQKADPWIEAGCRLLLDADAGAAHGGSGKTLDWQSLQAWKEQHPNIAWTLAGGLNPENVGEAILETGATSVDTASGVEETRGVKSEWLIRRFVVEARAALGK